MGRPGSPIQLLPGEGKNPQDQQDSCCLRHWGDLLRLCRAAARTGCLHRRTFPDRCTANTTRPHSHAKGCRECVMVHRHARQRERDKYRDREGKRAHFTCRAASARARAERGPLSERPSRLCACSRPMLMSAAAMPSLACIANAVNIWERRDGTASSPRDTSYACALTNPKQQRVAIIMCSLRVPAKYTRCWCHTFGRMDARPPS